MMRCRRGWKVTRATLLKWVGYLTHPGLEYLIPLDWGPLVCGKLKLPLFLSWHSDCIVYAHARPMHVQNLMAGECPHFLLTLYNQVIKFVLFLSQRSCWWNGNGYLCSIWTCKQHKCHKYQRKYI